MALTIPFVLPLVGGSWPASFAVWALPVAATAGLLALCPDGRQPQRLRLRRRRRRAGGPIGAGAKPGDWA